MTFTSFPTERFHSKLANGPELIPGSPCIVWTETSRDTAGYGQFWLDGRTQPAHRVAWVHKYGPIPDGMVLRHKCDNPPCCRVLVGLDDDHLILGTVADNNKDRDSRNRFKRLTGRANGNTILDDELVIEIRNLYDNQYITMAELARRFTVSESTISRIIRRETWKI
jgi:AraC-like DNA-binding protein